MSIETLPPNRITVQKGRVVRLEEWTCWNGSNEQTLVAEATGDEFLYASHDPEHGGGPPGRGTTMFEAASQCAHSEIAQKTADLFDLRNPTEQQIRDHHFRKGDGLVVEFADSRKSRFIRAVKKMVRL